LAWSGFSASPARFQRVARRDLRQALVVLVLGHVVAAFLVDLEEPVEEDHLARRAQFHLAVAAGHGDRGAFQPRGLHLAGDGALPDQVIKLSLIVLRQFQLTGRLGHVGGPDAFMRFLRVLGLVLVDARGWGRSSSRSARRSRRARRCHGLGRHVDAVGPHVGDVPGLVETLRRAHGLFRAEAELAGRLLLEGRGHEGRRGVAGGGLGLHPRDGQRAGGDGLDRQPASASVARS
jgi:hypothetical protein